MASAGRRPGPNRTREAIISSARRLFAANGFSTTTMRGVARAAKVNPALIHHYFGSKESLFAAALNLPLDPADAIAKVVADGCREEFPERFTRMFLTLWREPVAGRALQAALRRATSDGATAALIRQLAENMILVRLSDALDVPTERVAAAFAHLIGVVLAVTIIRVEPLASASTDDLVKLVSPAIAGYLNLESER